MGGHATPTHEYHTASTAQQLCCYCLVAPLRPAPAAPIPDRRDHRRCHRPSAELRRLYRCARRRLHMYVSHYICMYICTQCNRKQADIAKPHTDPRLSAYRSEKRKESKKRGAPARLPARLHTDHLHAQIPSPPEQQRTYLEHCPRP